MIFSRVFKNKTGRSFKEYLNRVRIEMAKKLMKEKEMNVSEACFTVGFNDLSYFSRVFHNLEGTTPSSYRKNSRKSG
ncbi:MAG: helix-turn-helix transcriptional regulator [Thermodesulfobacteriota bacterium]|nr:helix-turn-helix transcriptional regulator [Thermodesulfobacteriota bacterium]